jgi:chromosome segregation ATPase
MSKHVPSLQARVAELMKEVETLKSEYSELEKISNGNIKAFDHLSKTCNDVVNTCNGLTVENEKLKSDYAQLEDNYNILSKHHDDLIYKFNENLAQHKAIEAENHALKARN